MTMQGNFVLAKNIDGEGGAILQVFRHLSAEEQRIACAILDGMQLQRQLDAQKQEQTAISTTAK